MKIHKIQRFACLVPFFSSFFILVISMFQLKRYKASIKRWFQFYGLAISTFLLLFVLNNSVLLEQLVAKLIVSACITTAMNFLFIEIQIRAWNESVAKDLIDTCQKPKQKGLIGLVGLLGLILTITTIFMGVLLLRKPHPYKDYADTNGETDTSLALITQEDLLSGGKGIYGKGSSGGVGYGEQTRVGLNWSECDYDRIPQHWKFMTGVQTLQATKTDAKKLVLEIDSKLVSGNAEVIIIVDEQYYCHVPVNECATIALENISGKTVLVRMGCEAAEIDIAVTRTILHT